VIFSLNLPKGVQYRSIKGRQHGQRRSRFEREAKEVAGSI
jgi:hypothetical protein